jgi:hypothetical protein
VQQRLAGRGGAVVAGQQQGDEVAGVHLGAGGEEGEDGLVRRPHRAVGHDEDAAAGEQAGVGDGADAGGVHGGAGVSGQVHAAVAGAPADGGRVEAAAYDDRAGEGRDPGAAGGARAARGVGVRGLGA